MSVSQYSGNVNRYAGLSPDQVVLALAIELGTLQETFSAMSVKLDRIAEGQATVASVSEISRQLNELRTQTETRVRPLEDWRTSTVAQIRLAYGLALFMPVVSGIVGHFWK